jgi:hypothetical protein
MKNHHNEQLGKAGVLLALVTFKNEKSTVADGPFSEMKEVPAVKTTLHASSISLHVISIGDICEPTRVSRSKFLPRH